MKTKVEINDYEICVEETEDGVKVYAKKDDEIKEEFEISFSDDEEMDNDDEEIKSFDEMDEEEDGEDKMDDEEDEMEEDEMEEDMSESKVIKSFDKYIK